MPDYDGEQMLVVTTRFLGHVGATDMNLDVAFKQKSSRNATNDNQMRFS